MRPAKGGNVLLTEALTLFGFVPDDLRYLFTASAVTFWRWRTGRSRPPVCAVALAQILVNGELPHGGDAWAGWRFQNEMLISPEGDSYTVGDVRASRYVRALNSELRRLVRPASPPPATADKSNPAPVPFSENLNCKS